MTATVIDFGKFLFTIIIIAFVVALFLNPAGEVIPIIPDIFPFLEGKSIFELLYENTSNLLLFFATGALMFFLWRWKNA